jgi:hypothetical protein
MSQPTVVKVVAPARLDPLEDRVRRIVALSDGSERMEWWDFLGRAWVTCPYDVGTYALGFTLSEADRHTLGIPLDDLEALRVEVPVTGQAHGHMWAGISSGTWHRRGRR